MPDCDPRKKMIATVFLLGAYSLTAQVVLFRELYVLFAGNEFILSIVLSSWMVWVSLGSALVGKLREPREGRTLAGGFLIAALILFASTALIRIFSPSMITVPGELVTYGKTLLVSTVAVAPCAVLAGYLFSFASKAALHPGLRSFEAGGSVYTWEAWGSGFSGAALGLLLFNELGTLLCAVLFLAVALGAFLVRKLHPRGIFPATAVFLLPSLLFFLALPLEKRMDRSLESMRLGGYELVGFADSPYGRIDAVRREGQATLFSNSVPKSTSPNLAVTEEVVHFPLLLHPYPRRVLLLGGVMGDIPGEIARYHLESATGVELDGTAVKLAEDVGLFKPRSSIRVRIADARSFLHNGRSKYDAIIVALGEPATLQLNRYYTKEFFRYAFSRLDQRGVLATSFPGSENYYSKDQESFLACIYKTLKLVFPTVVFLPGGTCHFIAFKDSSKIYAPKELIRKLKMEGFKLRYVVPTTLSFRFSPMRMEIAKKVVEASKNVESNSDLTFSGYLYDMIHWNFRLGFKAASKAAPLIGKRRQLFAVLSGLFLLLYLSLLFLFPKPFRTRIAASSVMIAGFSGMAGSITMLIAFQIVFCALYQWIAILTGAFMVGAGLGSAVAKRSHHIAAGSSSENRNESKGAAPKDEPLAGTKDTGSGFALVHFFLTVLFLFFITVLLLCRSNVAGSAVKILFIGMQGFLGVATGAAYVIACRFAGEGKEVAPLMYALDLLGGFMGAALFAGIALPFLGLVFGVIFLAGVNAVALPASSAARMILR